MANINMRAPVFLIQAALPHLQQRHGSIINIGSLSSNGSTRAELNRLHPVGHVGAPQNNGNAAVYLSSDRADFITGQVLVVGGGRTAQLATPRDKCGLHQRRR